MRGRSKRRKPSDASPQQEPISLQLIASKLERLTWRRRVWGVDERQAWHVIQRMDEMYRQLYREQEVRYQALLAQTSGQSQTAQAGQPASAATAATAAPSAGQPSSAYAPLQAVPASRPPQRFRGETVPAPRSEPSATALQATPQAQAATVPAPSLGETRVLRPQQPAPVPPQSLTPGSHRFRTS